jgi:hypothetical protein
MTHVFSKILLSGLFLLIGFASGLRKPTTKIRYEIEPMLVERCAENQNRFVVLRRPIRHDENRLPLEFAGQSRLYQAIKNLRLTVPERRID